MYTIVEKSGYNSSVIVESVRSLIIQGWHPVGGIAMTRDDDGFTAYAQAMERPAAEDIATRCWMNALISEMQALETRRLAMSFENLERAKADEAPAYGEDAWLEIADRLDEIAVELRGLVDGLATGE